MVAHMSYLLNDESETDSNTADLRDGDKDAQRSVQAQGYSPAFERWLNNYRSHLDRVSRLRKGAATLGSEPGASGDSSIGSGNKYETRL